MISIRNIAFAAAALAIAGLAGPAAHADVMADSRDCTNLRGPAYAKRAIGICSRALQSDLISDKVRVSVLVSRGDGYRYMGDLEKAEKDYTEALALAGPQAFDPWYGRGLARSGMSKFDEAIEDFNRAAEIKGTARLYLSRGNAHAGKGDFNSAVGDYDRAISFDANMDQAYYARATAHNRLGNNDKAVADYMRAMEIGGESVTLDLQSYLKVKGKYRGKVDGKFGPASRKALNACVEDPGC